MLAAMHPASSFGQQLVDLQSGGKRRAEGIELDI
jgi:hypothetical protein